LAATPLAAGRVLGAVWAGDELVVTELETVAVEEARGAPIPASSAPPWGATICELELDVVDVARALVEIVDVVDVADAALPWGTKAV
jgi:hypothetical protein